MQSRQRPSGPSETLSGSHKRLSRSHADAGNDAASFCVIGSTTRRSSWNGFGEALVMLTALAAGDTSSTAVTPSGSLPAAGLGSATWRRSAKRRAQPRSSAASRRSALVAGMLVAGEADGAFAQQRGGVGGPSGGIEGVFHVGPEQGAAGGGDGLAAAGEGVGIVGGDGGDGRRRRGGIDGQHAAFDEGDGSAVGGGLRGQHLFELFQPGALLRGVEPRIDQARRRGAAGAPRRAGRVCAAGGRSPSGRGAGWCAPVRSNSPGCGWW